MPELRLRSLAWFSASAASFCTLFLALGAAGDPVTPAAQITRGDRLFAQGQLADAQVAYQAAVNDPPSRFTALCQLSRVESELGEDARGEEGRRWMAAAVGHARDAVKESPKNAHGHLWLAVALGRQAKREGPKTCLALSREIKSEVDRALALDPEIGQAYHVRALWNRRFARLSLMQRLRGGALLGGVPKGASMDNAVRDLLKAIELEPHDVNHRLELGRTYLMLKRRPEARNELAKALELSVHTARDVRYQTEAKELLARVPAKG